MKRRLSPEGSWGKVHCGDKGGDSVVNVVRVWDLPLRRASGVLPWYLGLLGDVHATPDCGHLCGWHGRELGKVGWEPSVTLACWCWASGMLPTLLEFIGPGILEGPPIITSPILALLTPALLLVPIAPAGRLVRADPGLVTSAGSLRWPRCGWLVWPLTKGSHYDALWPTIALQN